MENNNLSVNDTIMGKLRPSLKNRLISRKYNLNSDHSPNRNGEDSEIDLRSWGIEPILSNDAIFTNASIGQSFQAKWTNAVKQRKQENLQLDISASGVFPNKFGDDCSVISENMEYINNFIEENYQMVLTENIFITNPDSYHSIIPFLLMESKTIHRMTLSDYEIKMVLRSFQKKEKTNRIDAMDYYKIGLINFYRGKYLIAYSNFKKAIKSRNKDVNLMKWLAFTCLIIVFCHGLGKSTQFNTKINFKHIKDVEILDQKEETDEEESFLFGCCVTRKKKVNLNMSYMNKTDNLSIVESDIRVNRCSLCKEVEELLKNAATLDKEEKHLIELYWMYMIISVYNFLRPDQKVFAKEVSIQDINTSTSSTSTSMKLDPKVFVKKIKDKDLYMGYLVYAEYNYLLNQEFNINTILEELVTKFPNKIEAYLKYWYSLVKGKEKERDFKKAHQLSEIFWRNSSIINFDNNIYYLYITITHAKSLYYLGNNFYTITYFQKEYPANFLYPSIYYLFGKYSSKSNSKSLKNIALSSIHQSYKLLYEDLQHSALYWLGNVHYNSGNYDQCFKIWKLYYENIDQSFDFTDKKLEKIKNFRKTYELLGNSLNEFKKNLGFVRKENLKLKIIEDDSMNSATAEQLKDFLSDWKAIRELNPNIRENYTINYENYRGLIHFYVEKNISKGIRIFTNLINNSKYFMDPYFALWRILKIQDDRRILLNFSYYMIRIAHSSEVSFEDWIKSYILYARALFISTRYDDAVELLRNLLDIFANIPLDEIKFLSEVHKSNKISTTNNFVNFDYALSFYSKYHIYKKSEAIFHFNYKTKAGKEKFSIKLNENVDLDKESFKKKIAKSLTESNFNYKNSVPLQGDNKTTSQTNKFNFKNIGNEQHNNLFINDSLLDNSLILNQHGYLNTNEENFEQMDDFKKEMQMIKDYKRNSLDDADVVDININTIDELEIYVEKHIESIVIEEEYTFITIISNPCLLYEIGKFCAKSQLKSEMGLYCLKDYIQIVKFEYNYNLDDHHLPKKYKANFYIGVINCFLKQYNLAKDYFDKIKKTYLIEEKQNKISFIKAFYDFYQRFSNHSREEFNFKLNMKYL